MFGYSLPVILFKLNQITDMLLFIITYCFFYYTYIIDHIVIIISVCLRLNHLVDF